MLDIPSIVQILVSMAVVHGLQWAKASPRISWISDHTTVLNRGLAFVAALLTAAGVAWHFEGGLLAGGTLTLVLPPLQKILVALANTVVRSGVQVLMQQGYYRTVVK